MPKFEGAPNMNNAEFNPNEIGADVNVGKKQEGELTPEELEKLKAEEGQEQVAEEPELSPEEQLKNLEGEAEARQQEITKLNESVEGTKAKINEAREKLGLPPTEEDPPSVSSEKDKLEKLRAEQEGLEKQKEELISQQ
jgi:small-conductance mechanosensitive channel